MANFSTKLRDIIDARGISQAWVAEKAGTTEETISRYLSGIHKPNLDVVARICKALNVSIDYIMDLSLSPTPYTEPDKDVAILVDAFRRADEDHKNIIWSVLDSFLTPEEKTFVMPDKYAKSGSESSDAS